MKKRTKDDIVIKIYFLKLIKKFMSINISVKIKLLLKAINRKDLK